MVPARSAVQAVGWVDPDECRLDDLRAVVERTTDLADYPFATSTLQNVLIYDDALAESISAPEGRRAVQAELARPLLDGPGVIMFKHAFEAPLVERATEQFEAMIAEQRMTGAVAGDHFAKPGANDRVWGALDKLALRAPEVFVDYYAKTPWA